MWWYLDYFCVRFIIFLLKYREYLHQRSELEKVGYNQPMWHMARFRSSKKVTHMVFDPDRVGCPILASVQLLALIVWKAFQMPQPGRLRSSIWSHGQDCGSSDANIPRGDTGFREMLISILLQEFLVRLSSFSFTYVTDSLKYNPPICGF